MNASQARTRLEYLRGKLRAERISYGEIAELQSLVPYIEPGDTELLEWAGVPECLTEGTRTVNTPQEQAVESILATVSGTVFRSEAGEAIIMLRDDPYAISVDAEGHTVSAYLVTVPPAEIAAAMDADEGSIAGWTTGWDC